MMGHAFWVLGGVTVTGSSLDESGSSSADEPTVSVTDRRHEARSELREGHIVDRYMVLRRLGAGGMGEVYLAYDPKLDRQVALKLLVGSTGDPDTEARMQREAMALARLSHPNVVAVHDVGQHAGNTFIAMEYVQGRTLGEWLKDAQRPWRGILQAMMAAGRGLAAAHEAGLVHRDFKPGNVMVGDDGRVRVLDFGLARETTAAALPPSLESSTRISQPELLRVDVTRAGTVVGTPAYMAPEQFHGGHVDHRTDQFSFCVVLYRALFGQRPFEGDDAGQIAAAASSNQVRPIPAASPVPRAVRRVILRGLESSPQRRYGSMPDLLAELDRAGRARRRLVTGVVGGIAVLGSSAAWWLGRTESPCSTAGAEIAHVWNADRRARLQRSFADTKKAYATETIERAIPILDDYAQGWARARVEACEATHVRHTQSEALLDRRIACLDDRRHTLEALLSLFEEIEPGEVRNAMQALATMPSLDNCGAEMAQSEVAPPPPEHAERISTVRERLADIRARILAGRSEQALHMATELRREVEEIGYEPVTAEVLLAMGRASMQAAGEPQVGRDLLQRATELAERSGEERLVVESLAELAAYHTGRLGNPELTLWLAAYAKARGHRVGMSPRASYSLHLTRGGALFQLDRLEEAMEVYRTQVEENDDTPLGRFYRVNALQNLGSAYGRQGNFEESNRILAQALEEGQRFFGPDNPRLAIFHSNRANNAVLSGRYEEALEAVQEAMRLWRLDGGDGGPGLALGHQILSVIYTRTKQPNKSYEHSLRSYELGRKSYGDDHPVVGGALNNIAHALVDLGRSDEALRYVDQALAVYDKTEGPQSPRMPAAWDTRGKVLSALGRHEEALQEYEKALEHMQRISGSPYLVGQSKWGFGVARWETADNDEQRAEAVTSVQEARELLAGEAGAKTPDVVAIDAWLREHRSP